MQAPDTIDQRLTHLEIKASFAEDLLDKLDQVIVRQQQQIDRLERQVDELRQRSSAAVDLDNVARNPRDELPPHY